MVVTSNTFPTLLTEYRERLGISRNKLAKKVGVDPSYLTRIEHGDREPPRVGIVIALARELDLEPYEHDSLLMSAGYAPKTTVNWSPALSAVSNTLNNLTGAERNTFENVVCSLAEHWCSREHVTVD